MTHFLLIGFDQESADQLTLVLPQSVTWEVVVAAPELIARLEQETQVANLPDVLLLAVQNETHLTQQCQRLQQNPNTAHLPLVCVLTSPNQREMAFTAGVTDYLIQPFVAAEVQARLLPYLHPPLNRETFLLEAFDQINQGDLSLSWLFNTLEYLIEKALGREATFWLWDEARKQFHKYDQPAAAPLATYLSPNPSPTQIETVYVGTPPQPVLLIPIATPVSCKGVLTVPYEQLPQLTTLQKRDLTLLTQFVAYLLEISHLQEEVQAYATQTAFMGLIAKIIGEQLDLETILDLTLEHMANIWSIYRGEIWLLDADSQQLNLVSELTTSFAHLSAATRSLGVGFVGRVAQHKQTLNTSSAAAAFDPQYDRIPGSKTYQLLAVPLQHHDLTGVIAIYAAAANPFSAAQQTILEGIAQLVTSAIANTRLVGELRDFGRQQYVLYEMSQQLASGLDLQVCLNYAMGWATRLCQVEVGMLWLVNNANELELMASYGIEHQANIILNISECLIGNAVLKGQSFIENNPTPGISKQNPIFAMFNIRLRNILTIPMIYHGISIGALSLVNKLGSEFDTNDLNLLTTAVEMIAVAIGNAHLYAHTVALIDERERLHRQVIQTERLATVGRLTASLSHEINNPMQAIKGAMTLALEDLHDVPLLREYIELSLEQTDRVVHLVNRMKEIYRPHSSTSELINITHLLQDMLMVGHKAISRQNVSVTTHLAPDLPSVLGVANQLHLVFLSITLNLGDALGGEGGELRISTSSLPGRVQVQFATSATHLPLPSMPSAHEETLTEARFGLAFSHDIVQAHEGSLHITHQNGQLLFTITLPAVEES